MKTTFDMRYYELDNNIRGIRERLVPRESERMLLDSLPGRVMTVPGVSPPIQGRILRAWTQEIMSTWIMVTFQTPPE